MRAVQWGREGPIVLMLHGLGSQAGIWRAVGPALAARGARAIAVDLPGHGLTSKGADFDYTLEGHARWLEALVDAFAGAPGAAVHLVGSSLGGLWAAGFATRRPDRIRSLALIGSIGLAPLAPERCRWTADYLRRMDRESVASRLRQAVEDPGVVDETLIEEGYRMNNSPGAAAAFAALARYYLERLNGDLQLERLAARAASWPVLLIWGAEDRIVPSTQARAAAARIPASTLLLLAGAGHIPHLERPEAVTAGLAALVEERPVGDALPARAELVPGARARVACS